MNVMSEVDIISEVDIMSEMGCNVGGGYYKTHVY